MAAAAVLVTMLTAAAPAERAQPDPCSGSERREKSALVREALRALIQRESARRLARLGGTERALTDTPRRRSEPA